MAKTKLLIIGYSSFAQKRIIPSLNINNKFTYCFCSKSKKINISKKILYNNYQDALKKFKPEIVYISTVNSTHYKYAKKILEKGFNVIVDKPVTLNLKTTKKLLQIAKRKKLLFAEATLFNYHRVFDIIKKLCNGISEVKHIQSNFSYPQVKSIKKIANVNGDCQDDMSPYAAAVIRLFMKNSFKNIEVNKNYFKNTRLVKNFYIKKNSNTCTYFGNFSSQGEYTNQLIFYTKDKIIYSPQRIFALPRDVDLKITVKSKNKFKKIKVKRDDCINNFLKLVLTAIKNKKYIFFYKNILVDAKIRNIIKIN